jgi:hypothetical protein
VNVVVKNFKPNGAVDSIKSVNGSIELAYDYIFYYVVSANLTKGDSVLNDVAFGVYVQNNYTTTVAGVSRFVLHANGTGLTILYFDLVFDRATGLVIQTSSYGDHVINYGWLNTTLISTNVWTVPAGISFDVVTIGLVGVVGVVALVVGLLVGRHGKR